MFLDSIKIKVEFVHNMVTQIMVDLTIEFQITLWSVSAMPYSVNYEALG